MILTPEQIKTFQDDGILVVPNILTPHQVKTSLNELNETLLTRFGVDTNDLKSTGHNLVKLSSTNGSGGVLDLFYPNFKLDISTNEKLFHATCELWERCYRNQHNMKMNDVEEWMEHPFESFNSKRGYIYIDRIGYRLPTKLAEELGQNIYDKQQSELRQQNNDSNRNQKKKKKLSKLAIQRSLTPHLDCCPDTITSPNKAKWRPIQCFVSLTDNTEPNMGGFEAVRGGFHKEFHKWASTRSKTILKKNAHEIIEIAPPCIGEYTHIRPKEDSEIMKRVEHIPVFAGSAVFWDNRIPHANSYKHIGESPRVVIYCSFLPDIEINRIYARKQVEDFILGRIPRDQWIEKDENNNKSLDEINEMKGDNKGRNEEFIDKNYRFSKIGRKLMMLDDW